MTRQSQFATGILLVLFMAVASLTFAQFGSPFAPAPSDAMDTLSGGSVGPSAAAPLAGARAVAGQPGPPMPPTPGVPAPGAPTALGPSPAATPTPAPAGGYSYYGGYGGYGTAAGVTATPTPTPTPIETVRVLAGARVTDAVTGELIDDYIYLDHPKTMLEGYFFDDGTHGDEQAGDFLYSNVSQRNDVIGAETHQTLVRTLNSLQSANQMTPLEFYRLHVLTTEAISEIGKWRVEEAEKDKLLRGWSQRFVREFLKDTNDPTTGFYALYIAHPPMKPGVKTLPVTPDWRPPTSPQAKVDAAGAAVGAAGYAAGGGGYGGY